jgi:hypothetical protein
MMHMRDFVVVLRRDIERWHCEAARADAAGIASVAEQIRGWIAVANRIIDDSGY